MDTATELKYDEDAVIVVKQGEDLIEHSARTIEYIKRRYDDLIILTSKQNQCIDAVREYLVEAYDDLGEHAQEIAELLDIKLTREVEVTVNVEAYVTVTLAVGEDLDDVIPYLDVTFRDTDSITVDGYEMTDWNEQ